MDILSYSACLGAHFSWNDIYEIPHHPSLKVCIRREDTSRERLAGRGISQEYSKCKCLLLMMIHCKYYIYWLAKPTILDGSDLKFVFLRSKHKFWSNIFIEVFLADDIKFHGTLFKSDAFLVGILCSLRSLVVSDDRIKTRDQHETVEN